jgi:geranylgeranyl reductase family protein
MDYDVVIAGAGPAGSTAAKFLSEKGIKVLLLDKEKFPRDKPCGGGLPLRVLKRFRYIEENDLIESYSYGGYAYSSSLKYKASIEKNTPIVAMVMRKKFDMGLVRLAIDSGVDFVDGKAVEDVKILKTKAKIILDDKSKIDSEIVVGADGVWSKVAKKTGLAFRRNIDMCIFKEYEIDEETINNFFTEKKMCYIHSKFHGIPGYGWIFPKKQHINIGIAIIHPDMGISKTKLNLLNIYREYVKLLKETKVVPKNLKTEGCKGGALHTLPLEKTYGERVIIIGDAAGFTNPVSGEGIYYAMSSGEIAADVIAESLEKGDSSEGFLSKYQTSWKKDFGKDLELFLRAVKKWRKKSNEKFVELASKDDKLAEMAIGILQGGLSIDEYRWKLITRYLYVYFKDLLRII